jgi:hypothetical protein
VRVTLAHARCLRKLLCEEVCNCRGLHGPAGAVQCPQNVQQGRPDDSISVRL